MIHKMIMQNKFHEAKPERIVIVMDGSKEDINKVTNVETSVQATYSSKDGYIQATNNQRLFSPHSGVILSETVHPGKKMDYDLLEELLGRILELFGEDKEDILLVTDRGYSVKAL